LVQHSGWRMNQNLGSEKWSHDIFWCDNLSQSFDHANK
jgi:hypothetical protein